MFVVNVPKDCVFRFLERKYDVYALDRHYDNVTNLTYENVNDIREMLENDNLVYFVVEEEKEGK